MYAIAMAFKKSFPAFSTQCYWLETKWWCSSESPNWQETSTAVWLQKEIRNISRAFPDGDPVKRTWRLNVLFLKKFFGREKISLQCCVSFCHTTQINHSYMYISLLRLPPSSLMSSWKFIFILNPGLDKMIKSTT